ncbi:MAG: ATP-binding protein [Chloroflexi bacterium]|nr:ATP-binding protein [Chloroflexota bacterium]
MIQMPLANYTNEQTLFKQLVDNDAEPHILLLQGEGGSGKSHLIEHCLSTLQNIPSVKISCQSGGASIATLFSRLGRKVGWNHLPHFTQMVATLQEQPDKANDTIWQMGMHRHLREIGQISDVESRLSRYQLLTDAWFADAMQFDKPFVLAIDAYEKTPTLFAQWFTQEFLAGAAHSNRVRVVVSGQSVPEMQTAWRFCATLQDLKGIPEAKDWLAWAEAAGYQLPSLELMAGIVLALNGNPSKIIEVIKTQFPRSNGAIKPKASIAIQRQQIRKKIIDLFNLSELKDICFDLEIDYENLSNHNKKNDFVRELLAYAGRVNRLHELISAFQTERPGAEW